MKILVVEDEFSKKENIINLLNEYFEGNIEIHTAMSVRSAKNILKMDIGLDCIILDMSLPTYDIGKEEFGGRPRGFGGKDVIRQVIRQKQNIPILVLTAYEAFSVDSEDDEKDISLDELTEQLDKYTHTLILQVVKYNTLMDDWKNKVIEFLEKLK